MTFWEKRNHGDGGAPGGARGCGEGGKSGRGRGGPRGRDAPARDAITAARACPNPRGAARQERPLLHAADSG